MKNIIKQIIIFLAFFFLLTFTIDALFEVEGIVKKIIGYCFLILYPTIKFRKNIIWTLKPSTIKIHLKGELSIYEIIVFIFCLIPSFLLIEGVGLVALFLQIPHMPGMLPPMEIWQFPLYLRIIIKFFL